VEEVLHAAYLVVARMLFTILFFSACMQHKRISMLGLAAVVTPKKKAMAQRWKQE
jgi:hypothetical protein